ncbi:MAG: DUF3467 domain-containing protein [Planctomycetes bacterium]|nr:DUF3467 domain-containing protein [Planctomycetota bacterium]
MPLGSDPKGGFDSGYISGEFRHQPLSARVPDNVVRGVFSTGLIILTNPTEFVLDFLCRMSRPYQVAARIIVPPAVMPQMIGALRDNANKFTEKFGPIPQLPKPDNERRPSIQEVYDDLKIPDDVLSGSYANAVMIGHTPAEFCFDFITGFFPRSAVSSRVFLSAPHIPRVLESMVHTFNEYQRRLVARQNQPGQTPGQTPPQDIAPPVPPPQTPNSDEPHG